jgi:hypothetical protein
MAKRKSISISPKPTAGLAAPVQPDAPPRDGSAIPAARLDPPASPLHRAPPRPKPPGAAQAGPAGPLGKLVYGAVFGVSYGVAFTAILLVKLMPGGTLVGRACRDGTAAAGRWFEEPMAEPAPARSEA